MTDQRYRKEQKSRETRHRSHFDVRRTREQKRAKHTQQYVENYYSLFKEPAK